MLKVYKYTFKINDYIEIELPKGAKILKFDCQHGDYCVWALVNPRAPHTIRKFRFCGTGHSLTQKENLEYINTFYQNKGMSLVWHIFEIKEGLPDKLFDI